MAPAFINRESKNLIVYCVALRCFGKEGVNRQSEAFLVKLSLLNPTSSHMELEEFALGEASRRVS